MRKTKEMAKIMAESVEYLNKYIEVTDAVKAKITKHVRRYNINPEICA